MEDAATEIQVQGLELDYACVLWDADMRYENKKWNFYTFNGQTEWKKQNLDNDNQKELILLSKPQKRYVSGVFLLPAEFLSGSIVRLMVSINTCISR